MTHFRNCRLTSVSVQLYSLAGQREIYKRTVKSDLDTDDHVPVARPTIEVFTAPPR
ncbi:hypothetical protein [Pseudodesulfovibrio piezophilus]|uniref:Uncharacterized protein n=1 Tax=Pseudodesulfovibrio piezophilus (strain DSM 21447 / JCM 15486 / C1TLV30) TaxID=1322246 RepID=M1WQ51_PSEP2|nr:hypothetical protein [Pseudodesulfovibrio piezophilus]CCH48774.1 protein of unknown function [Pseudodesulfovibrio piezophilus C1TLV30]